MQMRFLSKQLHTQRKPARQLVQRLAMHRINERHWLGIWSGGKDQRLRKNTCRSIVWELCRKKISAASPTPIASPASKLQASPSAASMHLHMHVRCTHFCMCTQCTFSSHFAQLAHGTKHKNYAHSEEACFKQIRKQLDGRGFGADES